MKDSRTGWGNPRILRYFDGRGAQLEPEVSLPVSTGATDREWGGNHLKVFRHRPEIKILERFYDIIQKQNALVNNV